MSRTGKIRKRQVKKCLRALIAVLVLGIIGTTGLGIWRKRHAVQESETKPAASEGETKKISLGEVNYEGKSYKYNDHLSNFLFMGVDSREKVETTTGQANAGQADAIFLISWDRVAHNMSVVSIPRDTMAEIEVFDQNGDSLGTTTDHINLAYAYGDGKNESCNLMKQAVSNLLYGLPIQGYCALNMDGIPTLIDGVGGVTVTIPNDSLEEKNPEWKKGAQAELTPENAETFVRYRNIEKDQSAMERLERQMAFLEAYGNKATKVYSKNPSLVTELYEKLNGYMVTNIGTDQYVKILQDFSSDPKQETWSIPGEGVSGGDFDEYHVDDQELYKLMIQHFYVETEQEGT